MDPRTVDTGAIEAWLQCERRAWLRRHAPERASSGDGLHRFLAVQRSDLRTLLARRFGTESAAGGGGAGPAGRRDRTRDAVRSGADVVLDAAFEAVWATGADEHGVRILAEVDALQRGRSGWGAFVLSAGSHVREHHVRRLTLAALAAAGSGIGVEHASVLHVERRPAGARLALRATDVDHRVERQRLRLPPYVAAVAASLRSRSEPRTAVGRHCRRPRPCPFQDHCRASLSGRSVDHVWGLRATTRQALRSAGWVAVSSVPDDPPGVSSAEAEALSDARRNHVRFERGAVRTALDRLSAPVGFLDIEFATPAVPWVPGMAPFEPLPFQFSLDVETGDGDLRHSERLELEAGVDPRPQLARALAAALEGVGSIVVYDASSEARLLTALGAFEPPLGAALQRLWDLQDVVMRYVRHPDFEARWDLKRVAGALAHGSYRGVQVANGLAAQTSWRRLLARPDRSAERALRRYCAADSHAMVEVVRTLRGWTASEAPAS